MWLNDRGLGALVGWTLRHQRADHEALKPAAEMPPLAYPKYDGVLTFDKLSSVFVSNTNHEENQPSHLQLRDPTHPGARQSQDLRRTGATLLPCRASMNLSPTKLPATRPSGCRSTPQNCVHCKTCDIKDPLQNIHWVTPEGGGGPNYSNM